MSMEHKVALVTGGASGIGRASALRLAEAGAAVVVADVNVTGGEETAHLITQAGGRAIFVKCDVTQGDSAAAMVSAAVQTFGRLDAAVNNAGISGSLVARIHETEEADFDRIMAVNLKGVWWCMKHEIPVMLSQGSGAIVNVASVAGLVGAPRGSAYTASKHAVVGLTKSASVEYAKAGLRVNAVCPAYTETPMVMDIIELDPAMAQLTTRAIPMKRLGKPQEIAEGVLWLCSEAASFVTGHMLVLDGGLIAM